MSDPLQLTCELCGSKADVVMNAHTDASGKRIEWPKANVKSDGIYFMISCTKCGEREQCVSRPDDTD